MGYVVLKSAKIHTCVVKLFCIRYYFILLLVIKPQKGDFAGHHPIVCVHVFVKQAHPSGV